MSTAILARSFALLALGLSNVPAEGQSRSMEQDPSLNNLVHPKGYETAPPNQLAHVEVRGSGPVPMVLVPGGGFGWDVFEDFMEANRDEYTMYAVTLAGMGGTPAPPMPPDGTSYGAQTWTRGAVRALVELIAGERFDRPVVAGHFLEGTQVALRLALDRPELVRGVVLLSGAPVMMSPERSFTVEERIRYQDEYMAPEWFKTVTLKTWNDNNFPPKSYSRDPGRGEELFDRVSRGPLPVFVRYLLEFWASDLTTELDELTVPLLVLQPDFDVELLKENPWLAYYFTDSWTGAQGHPRIDIEVVDDAHIFVWMDRPEIVDGTIDSFVRRVSR